MKSMKSIRKPVCILLMLALTLVCLTTAAFAEDASIIDSGTCGTGLTWELTEGGVLTISGEGEMNYSAYREPWRNYKDSVTAVVIEEGVTNVGVAAFSSCTNLAEVSIPSTVTCIGENAFWGCEKLTGVTLPDGLTTIEFGAFENCSGLTSLIGPETIESVATNAFSGCDALPVDENGFQIIYGTLYAYKGSAGEIVIPDSVSCIGGGVFNKNEIVTSVVIPRSVTGLGVSAFSDCDNLTSVVIPGSITNMGRNIFSDCDNLTSVVIEDGVTKLYYGMFESCDSLKSVHIPDSVTYIDYAAFSGCDSLTEILLPADVSLSWYAFSGCDALEYVEFKGNVSFGMSAFDGCTGLKNVKFCGDAPEIDYEPNIFGEVNAVAYYPMDNSTWTEEWFQSYRELWFGYGDGEVSGDFTWIPYTGSNYEILDGADSVVDISSNNGLTIRASGELSKFKEVQVDGVIVDPSNYTVTEGSTIVAFSADYLKTLSEGEHVVKFIYADGEVSTVFTIEAGETEQPEQPDDNDDTDQPVIDSNPETGDTGMLLAVLVIAVMGAAVVIIKNEKLIA